MLEVGDVVIIRVRHHYRILQRVFIGREEADLMDGREAVITLPLEDYEETVVPCYGTRFME